MTYDEFQATIAECESEFQTPMKAYYIGNCGAGQFDDRSWAVRFYEYEETRRPRDHMAMHNLVLGPTATWREMSAVKLALALARRLERLQYAVEADEPLVRQIDLSAAMERRNAYSSKPFVPQGE